MLTLVRNIILLIFIVSMVTVSPTAAQPAHKAKQRIQLMKKMKLLDYLDLDEATSEKFLIKYNAQEKEVHQRMKELDEKAKELKKIIKKGSPEEITKSTQEFMAMHDEVKKLYDKKISVMRPILDDIAFAKYVLFEFNFHKELNHMMMRKMKSRAKREGRRSGKRSRKREAERSPRD